jgi:hypothetical protein
MSKGSVSKTRSQTKGTLKVKKIRYSLNSRLGIKLAACQVHKVSCQQIAKMAN